MPIVFLPGFSGDVRPNFIDRLPRSPFYLLHRLVNGPVFGRFDRESSDRWTSSLAEVVLRTASAPPIRIDVSKIRCARSQIPMRDLIDGDADKDLTFHAVHFDPGLSLLGVSAEVVIEYATALSERLSPRKLLPVGYIDGVAAYLPTSEMLSEGGLEVSRPATGRTNPPIEATSRISCSISCAKNLLLARNALCRERITGTIDALVIRHHRR